LGLCSRRWARGGANNMKNNKITTEQIEFFIGSDNLLPSQLMDLIKDLANKSYNADSFKEDVLNHWEGKGLKQPF